MTTYKALIFDLGKVLVHFDFQRGYRALAELAAYPAEEIPKRLWKTDLVRRFETGLVEPRDFVTQITAILEIDVEYDAFCQIWSCIFCETLIPEPLIEDLSHRYRLVLLSNTNQIHFEMVAASYPILRHFEYRVLSYEAKSMKPDGAIFRRAIELAGCNPEECFFTDDIEENIEAARKLGIDAVTFHSATQLEVELRQRGLL